MKIEEIAKATVNQGIDQFIGPLVKRIPANALKILKGMQADKLLPILSIIFSSVLGEKSAWGNTLKNLVGELTGELSGRVGEGGVEEETVSATTTKSDLLATLLNHNLSAKLADLLTSFTEIFEEKSKKEEKAIWVALKQMSKVDFLLFLSVREKATRDQLIERFIKVEEDGVSFQEKLKAFEQHPVVQGIMVSTVEKMCQDLERKGNPKAVEMRAKLEKIKEREAEKTQGGVL